MAGTAASPLSCHCTDHSNLSQALSLSEAGGFCALWNNTLCVTYYRVLENDGPSFETTITFIGGRGERGGEMDRFAVPSSSNHVFIYTLEYLNGCNVHSPTNIYTVLSFFSCSLRISIVTIATLVFSLADDLNLLLSLCKQGCLHIPTDNIWW